MLKHIPKNVHIGIFILFGLFLLGNAAMAQETSMAVKGICEYGQDQYKRGIREDAVHEFKKVLILDPDNQVAKTFIALPPIEDELVQVKDRLSHLRTQAAIIEKMMADVCPYPPDKCDTYFGVRQALCEYGVGLYKEGKKDDAMHELGKLLMVDAKNETALAYIAHNNGSCQRLQKDLDALKSDISSLAAREAQLQAQVDAAWALSCQ